MAELSNTVDLTSLDDALALAAPRLDSIGQQVAVAAYRTLAYGRPVAVARIASMAGVDEHTVERLLDEWGAVFRDDEGQVLGFWGLAVADMPHRLRVDDEDLYAWCAWDPMFLACVIGPMAVTTTDAISGEAITYRLDGDGRIRDLSHPESVLSFLRPDREWDDQVMAAFCHYVLHFTGPATARQWTADHPGTFVLGLDDAVELARLHTDRCFGDALR